MVTKRPSLRICRAQENYCEFRVASERDFDHMITIVDDYYDELEDEIKPLNKHGPPWSWISEGSVSSQMLIYRGEACGFFVARHVCQNTHLHSFFVEKKHRGKGIAKVLLRHHWREALRSNPTLETFTLHTHQKNKNISEFYQKFGYQRLNQNPSLLKLNNGFGSWARNCEQKDQWPLRQGIDIYGLIMSQAFKNSLGYL